MDCILVNLDDREYFSTIALAGRPEKDTQDFAPHQVGGPSDPVPLLLKFAGSMTLTRPLFRCPEGFPVESWVGNRIAYLHSKDESDTLVPEEVRAMQILAGKKVSSYDYVRDHFQDITADIKGW